MTKKPITKFVLATLVAISLIFTTGCTALSNMDWGSVLKVGSSVATVVAPSETTKIKLVEKIGNELVYIVKNYNDTDSVSLSVSQIQTILTELGVTVELEALDTATQEIIRSYIESGEKVEINKENIIKIADIVIDTMKSKGELSDKQTATLNALTTLADLFVGE